jgi:NTE family protein
MNTTKIFPFENLVFEGGGVLGVAYQGAWEVLEKAGLSKHILRVCGTSAGTISATMIALGFSAKDCKEILLKAPFDSFKDGGWIGLWRLFFKFGWYKGNKMEEFFESLIEMKTGNPKSTFKELNDKGYKELFLISTNLTQISSMVFSHLDTPDLPVAEGMRMSSSVPLFFEAKKYRGDLHVDGGVMRNYAISEFDEYFHFEKTLGFFLRDPKKNPKPIKGLISYKENIIAALKKQLLVQIEKEPIDKRRTVFINDLGIGSLDFKISEEQRLALMYQGVEATELFLKRWEEEMSC